MLSIFELLINYVFPPTCLSCSEFTSESHKFCSKCWKKFNFITKPYCKICGAQFELAVLGELCCGRCLQTPPVYDFARSLLKFDENSRKIIHMFKYQDKVELAKTFAMLLCKPYRQEIIMIDYVVPVPMHKLKRLFRMYNQADLLCIEIAKMLCKPRYPDILVKTKWTKSQIYLKRKARKQNLENSIKFNPKYNVQGKSILLIDDVMTTGSTVEYCSKILKAAGAKTVIVLTVAMR